MQNRPNVFTFSLQRLSYFDHDFHEFYKPFFVGNTALEWDDIEHNVIAVLGVSTIQTYEEFK